MKETKYNFGEKKEEYHASLGKNIPVWESPKYILSKNKAIELIEKSEYGLDTGDFWILMNATKSEKMMYTGLIISHNGCLKINDKLPEELKFKPLSVSFVKDAGEKEKTMAYINQEQGVYEFGEISTKNCKNDYPYAMVLKRLMDRVILKNSKVGFFGIYSEAESDDFKDKPEPKEEAKKESPKNAFGLSKDGDLASGADMTETFEKAAQDFFAKIKKDVEECGSLAEVQGLEETNKAKIEKLKNYSNLHTMLSEAIKKVKDEFVGEQ